VTTAQRPGAEGDLNAIVKALARALAGNIRTAGLAGSRLEPEGHGHSAWLAGGVTQAGDAPPTGLACWAMVPLDRTARSAPLARVSSWSHGQGRTGRCDQNRIPLLPRHRACGGRLLKIANGEAVATNSLTLHLTYYPGGVSEER